MALTPPPPGTTRLGLISSDCRSHGPHSARCLVPQNSRSTCGANKGEEPSAPRKSEAAISPPACEPRGQFHLSTTCQFHNSAHEDNMRNPHDLNIRSMEGGDCDELLSPFPHPSSSGIARVLGCLLIFLVSILVL